LSLESVDAGAKLDFVTNQRIIDSIGNTISTLDAAVAHRTGGRLQLRAHATWCGRRSRTRVDQVLRAPRIAPPASPLIHVRIAAPRTCNDVA
jgi:hypothetical protein